MTVLMSVMSQFFTTSIFFGSILSPSRLTTCPRYSASIPKRIHLLAFMDNPAHRSLSNTARRRVIICSKEASSLSWRLSPIPVLQTPTSSRYGMQVSQARPWRAASIRRTMYDGPLWIPNGR